MMCGWGLCTFGDSGSFGQKCCEVWWHSFLRFDGCAQFCVRCVGECGMLVVLEVRLFGSV